MSYLYIIYLIIFIKNVKYILFNVYASLINKLKIIHLMYKELEKSDFYESSKLSFIFEFKSPIRRRDMSSKLSKNLGKKIKWFKGVNEYFKPNNEIFKLSNKYSENSKFFIFETGYMNYQDAIHTMIKTMNIIDYFGYTDNRCEMKVKVSVNEKNFPKLNKFKYIIGLNESEILEKWNTDENERHKVNLSENFSLNSKDPYNTILSTRLVERMDSNTFNFPKSEFFGLDFEGLNEGFFMINYIGGKNYHKRKREAVDTINSIIDRINETLKDNWNYNIDEKRKIEKLVENYRNIINNTKTFTKFKSNYPDLQLYFDLRNNNYLLEANYNNFREKIFELIAFGGVTEGEINWDNERKMIQVKDAKIKKNMMMEKFEFYECIVEADVKDCLFDRCTIRNSKLENCDIITSNFIKISKVLECKYHGVDNQIFNSFLDNDPKNMINANLKKCLINRGTLGIDSHVDKDTIILNK